MRLLVVASAVEFGTLEAIASGPTALSDVTLILLAPVEISVIFLSFSTISGHKITRLTDACLR